MYKYLNNYFLYVNIFFLIILLIFGENGPLQDLDFSDHYLDKSKRISEEIKNLKLPGVDYSMIGRLNLTYGSIPINHLMILFDVFFETHTSAHLFIFFTDIFVFFGIFYFLKIFFSFEYKNCFIFSLIIFFYLLLGNENYIVNQYLLLPFLICLNWLFTKEETKGYLAIILLLIYCSFSYPPYNIPIAPILHFLILFFLHLNKSINFKKYFLWFTLIWLTYFCYHFSLIVSILDNYLISNRVIWENFEQPNEIILRLKDPLEVLIVLIIVNCSKEKIKNLLISIFIIFIPEILDYLIQSSNFIISRVSYSNKIILIFYLILISSNKKNDLNQLSINISRSINLIIFSIYLLIYKFLNFDFNLSNLNFNLITTSNKDYILIFLSILMYLFFIIKKTFLTNCVFSFMLIFTFKLMTLILEPYKTGFLYTDEVSYPKNKNEYRIVSLINECGETIFNSSQILIRGYNSLDGTSVFYPKIYANDINKLKNNFETCKGGKKFKYWNNRINFTVEEFNKNNNLFSFFKNNNVRFIRSREKIDHSEIKLFDSYNYYNASFLRYSLDKIKIFKKFLDKNLGEFEKKEINVFVYEINNWIKINEENKNYLDKYLLLKKINILLIISSLFGIFYIKKILN